MTFPVVRTTATILSVSILLGSVTHSILHFGGPVEAGQIQFEDNGACSIVLVQNARGISRDAFSCDFGNESQLPSDDSRVAVGSITKMFTAVVILTLCADNRMSLDARLGDYVEEFAETEMGGAPISSLLQHTSGLDANDAHVRIARNPRYTSPDIASVYNGLQRLYPQEFVYHYSSGNYNLLALAAERVTGENFARLLEEFVFRPLKMDSSGFISKKSTVNTLHPTVYPHSHMGARQECDLVSSYAGGSAYSTVTDLARFGSWLAGNLDSVLDQSMVTIRDLMYNYSIPKGSRYGAGFLTAHVLDLGQGEDYTYRYHDSRICGYVAHVGSIRELGLSIVVVSNMALDGRCLDSVVSDVLKSRGLKLKEELRVEYEIILDWRAYLEIGLQKLGLTG